MTASARLALGLAFVLCPLASAQEAEEEPLEDRSSRTTHTASIGGKVLTYEATAGTLVLREEDGEPKAEIFYVAYMKSGSKKEEKDAAARPLTFCFNGGPGSSSVWLHMGVFGPKRVVMTEDGWAPPPPYQLTNNEYSLLDVTDLVFIDPTTTGFSRPAEDADPHENHGYNQDVQSVGEFIRLFTTRHERWSSPKFLAGESYGTTRAAGLSDHLQSRHGMYLNGLILVSSILNFQTARFDRGNDLPYPLFLPTYTATAWYHGQLAPDLQENLRRTLDEVEEFALGEYTLALMQGDRLSGAERNRIAKRLARYTGLSVEYILSADLRPVIGRFCKELRRDEDLTVGRLDSRFTGRDVDSSADRYEFDPSYAAIQGPYTGTVNAYLREDLGFESDLPYEILTGRVHPWDYSNVENRYLNVAETLRRAMAKNPDLKVYVANGYYDLATPYFASQYTFDHLGLPPETLGNVSMGFYESGHMMYIHMPSLVKFKDEVARFILSSSNRR